MTAGVVYEPISWQNCINIVQNRNQHIVCQSDFNFEMYLLLWVILTSQYKLFSAGENCQWAKCNFEDNYRHSFRLVPLADAIFYCNKQGTI